MTAGVPLLHGSKELRNAVQSLRAAEASEAERIEAAVVVFELCHNSRRYFRECQVFAARLGAIDPLVSLGGDVLASQQARTRAFRALGQMCFLNDKVSTQVGGHEQLVQVIAQVTSSQFVSESLQDEALFTVNNAAGNAWGIHHHLFPLLPHIVRLFARASNAGLKMQCVHFVGVLAYNSANKAALTSAGVLPLLLETMHSTNTSLSPVSAAIAVACIAGGNPQGENFHMLDIADNTMLVMHLVEALHATLRHTDFPRGTGWKLLLGLRNLCAHRRTRNALRAAGLGRLLRIAIAQGHQDSRLTQHALGTLWQLSDDCRHTRQPPPDA